MDPGLDGSFFVAFLLTPLWLAAPPLVAIARMSYAPFEYKTSHAASGTRGLD